ncbi:MAG: PrpF domain-containing protein [Pseudobdellovibrio sp.]
MKSLRAMFMRGGTSKALMVLKTDLPSDQKKWDQIFLSLMGSPDSYGRQLNGMGGGVSSLSKIAVIGKSHLEGVDLDYTFVQVGIEKPVVDYKGNCGNISSAVAPFAVESQLLELTDGDHEISIYNTNTQKIIKAKLNILNGKPNYNGKLSISGVNGAGADIELSFISPAGASTGSLYPCGEMSLKFTNEDFKESSRVLGCPSEQTQRLKQRFLQKGFIDINILDVANACFFIKAQDLDLAAIELPDILNQDKDLLKFIDIVRAWISVKMGVAKTLKEAQDIATIPYGVIYSEDIKESLTTDGELISGQDCEIVCRAIAGKKIHQALPLTVSLCVATFKVLKKILCENKNSNLSHVKIGTPAGVIEIGVEIDLNLIKIDPLKAIQRGVFLRTARLLMKGDVYYL